MILARNSRQGAVVPLVAVSLIGLIAMMGLVIDGGFALEAKRLTQNAADAAAMAGCHETFTGGVGAGVNLAIEYACVNMGVPVVTGSNGTPVTSGDVTVTVNIPPKHSANAAMNSNNRACEVYVTRKVSTFFMAIVGTNSTSPSSRGVAAPVSSKFAILILNPTMKGAAEVDTKMNVTNGEIWSNSDGSTNNDAASAYANPKNDSVYVGGNIHTPGINARSSDPNAVWTNGGQVNYTNSAGTQSNPNGKAVGFQGPGIPDPLAKIPEASFTGTANLKDGVANPANQTTDAATGLTNYGSVYVNGNVTLQPGIYHDITVGGGNVSLAPGMYYIDRGGSFSVYGGNVTGSGVMIVNDAGMTTPGNSGAGDTSWKDPSTLGVASGSTTSFTNGRPAGYTGPLVQDNRTGDYNLVNGKYQYAYDSVMGWNNTVNGVVNLTPPTPTTGGTWPMAKDANGNTVQTTAETYAGISMWTNRNNNLEVHLRSNKNMSMTGTVYGQNVEYDIRPQGTNVTFTAGGYIADRAEWGQGSNGTININTQTSALTGIGLAE
ncbi:hypothetical protein AYO44_00625 [Planctomycetaceae bacterium SCGC AG-212-F19]|nr:hypothetical protein AYO44_00625 [Planctomycetaceae bacterium SCGC AG-212-F19]